MHLDGQPFPCTAAAAARGTLGQYALAIGMHIATFLMYVPKSNQLALTERREDRARLFLSKTSPANSIKVFEILTAENKNIHVEQHAKYHILTQSESSVYSPKKGGTK